MYSFENEVKYKAFALPDLLVLIVFIFLTRQTSSEDVSSENEWLGFLSLRELRKLNKVPNAKIGSFVVSAFNEEKV